MIRVQRGPLGQGKRFLPGKRFLAGGERVDYGPGRVERPQSKEVRFVKIHDFEPFGDGSR